MNGESASKIDMQNQRSKANSRDGLSPVQHNGSRKDSNSSSRYKFLRKKSGGGGGGARSKRSVDFPDHLLDPLNRPNQANTERRKSQNQNAPSEHQKQRLVASAADHQSQGAAPQFKNYNSKDAASDSSKKIIFSVRSEKISNDNKQSQRDSKNYLSGSQKSGGD